MANLTKGYLIALLGTTVWSSTGILIRYLTGRYGLPPLVLAWWRDLFVAAGLAAVLALVKPGMMRVGRRHAGFLLAYGLSLAAFNALWTVSVALNGAAVATVLAYNSGAFTALLGWRLLGERLGIPKAVAVILSLAGCVLVSGAYDLAVWRVNPAGIATGLLSGLGFAAYTILGRASARRRLPAWGSVLYSFLAAAGFLLIFQLVPWIVLGHGAPQLLWLGDSAAGWGVLVALALGPTLCGYGLYVVSLAYLPASIANLIAALEPAITALLAHLLLGENLTVLQLLGGALVLGGVVLLRIWGPPEEA